MLMHAGSPSSRFEGACEHGDKILRSETGRHQIGLSLTRVHVSTLQLIHQCLMFRHYERFGLNGTDLAREWGPFLEGSGCPVYPSVAGGHIFHVYWRADWWAPANLMPIESFLATQDLDAGHRLHFWHNPAWPPPSDVVERYAGPESPYRHYIRFMPFHVEQEISGTCYEVRRWALSID